MGALIYIGVYTSLAYSVVLRWRSAPNTFSYVRFPISKILKDKYINQFIFRMPIISEIYYMRMK